MSCVRGFPYFVSSASRPVDLGRGSCVSIGQRAGHISALLPMATPPSSVPGDGDCKEQQWSCETNGFYWGPGFPVPIPCVYIPRHLSIFQKKREFYRYLQLLGGDPSREGFSPYFVPPVTYPGDCYGGLERYWIQGFLWLFIEFYNEYGNVWTLEPTEHPAVDEPNTSSINQWTSFVHTAKVRFNCQKSGHGWTSMQGRVVFWFRKRSDCIQGTLGQVLFKLYGQKCDKCNKGLYETPLWYPEEVFNALWHLHLKIGECYYGRPPIAGPRGVRSGKPLRPHRPELCQACSDGICRSMNKERSAQN